MQRATLVFLSVLLGFLLTGAAGAQIVRFPTPTPSPTPRPSPSPTPEPRAVPCPNVNVQLQSGQTVRDGQPVGFMANIAGGDPRVSPTILWSTSAGTIKQGQYTRRIEVDSSGAGSTPDRELVAELWVGGYAPECVLQAKAIVKIIAPAVKFGEFGELPADAVTFHLKTLAKYLSQSPDNLYLIAYAGRQSDRGFTFQWMKRMKEQLIDAGIASRRIIAFDGGFREEPLFEFWIVPNGAEPPRPTPTINRNDIVYPKTVPPKKP